MNRYSTKKWTKQQAHNCLNSGELGPGKGTKVPQEEQYGAYKCRGANQVGDGRPERCSTGSGQNPEGTADAGQTGLREDANR